MSGKKEFLIYFLIISVLLFLLFTVYTYREEINGSPITTEEELWKKNLK